MEVTKIVLEEDFVCEKPVPPVKSMARQKSKNDKTREALWERRRRQAMRRERTNIKAAAKAVVESSPRRMDDISKDDVDELMGSIELGFEFDEDQDGGRELCQTLPALDLYFAINRSSKMLNYSSSNASTPSTAGETSGSSQTNESRSPTTPVGYDYWKLLQPGRSTFSSFLYATNIHNTCLYH